LFLPNVVQSTTSDSATLQWAANIEPDLAGYRIYHGTAPGVYGVVQAVGTTTTYQYTNLEPSKTHYFTITAFDTAGNESLPSLEVSKTIAALDSQTSSSTSTASNTTLVGDSLLTDDFNDGNFAGWQVVNEGTWDAPSVWGVVGGALQQTSNIYDGNTDGTVLPKKGTYAWYTNGPSWSNYQVAVQMRSMDDDAVGVMVRYQNPTNYYRFSWDAQRRYRRLVKVVNGEVTLLRQDAVPYLVGQSYQVAVMANGNTLEVRVDGVPLFGGPVVDSALSTGSVALYSWGNIGSVFDNVQVSPVGELQTLPTLTVTKGGTGGGMVTSSPAGITCEPTCAANFASGTLVTLTATPAGTSRFEGWSGDADCSDGQVLMMGSVSCTATFTSTLDVTPPSITLTSPINGSTLSGEVTINATATDNSGVAGVQFQLNGNNLGAEDTTSPFSISWDSTGVVPGPYAIAAIARDAAGNTSSSVPVNISISSPPSTLTVSIAGSGSVTSSPDGIRCTSGTCSASYRTGSAVMLTAKANKKWTFSGWSGACSGTGECVVQLSANQLVGATFSQNGNGRGNKK
jgi:hypothetical protein